MLNLCLNCSPRELQIIIIQNCRIKDSAAKRELAGHAVEMLFVDDIVTGSNPQIVSFLFWTTQTVLITAFYALYASVGQQTTGSK